MRMRKRKKGGSGADVIMSPLIDCVFLLLIFFLVTSMLKRWERQIPVTLADPTAAVAVEAEADAYRMAIDAAGNVYHEAGRNWDQDLKFAPVGDLPGFLHQLATEKGVNTPIEISVEREVRWQDVIDIVDVFQLQGFTNVRPRLRNEDL